MSNLIDYDTLTLEDLATLQRRVQEKLDIKRVLARHTSPISELPNHRWFTRLNGRKIERQTKEELLQELVKRYYAMDQGLYDEKPKVKKIKRLPSRVSFRTSLSTARLMLPRLHGPNI